MNIKNLKLVYTDMLSTEKTGKREKENYPGDKEYEKLCIEEPCYERIGVYIQKDVDKLLLEYEKEVEKLNELLKNARELIDKNQDNGAYDSSYGENN
jgi:hypothetical protein